MPLAPPEYRKTRYILRQGTRAAQPAASSVLQGTLYYVTDEFKIEQSDGTSWSLYGFSVGAASWPDYTAPIDANFAWINQAGSSITATTVQGASALYLLQPASGAGVNSLAIRKKAAPSTPYTITIAYLPNNFFTGQYVQCGLCFRESGSGKVVTWGNLIYAALPQIAVIGWTNPTTFSAFYAGSPQQQYGPLMSPIWLRIADNGVNRICSYSGDGKNFTAFHTVGRTDFLTANEVGFFVNNASASLPGQMTLLSWKEA